jgi:hypothetical protein
MNYSIYMALLNIRYLKTIFVESRILVFIEVLDQAVVRFGAGMMIG